MTCVYNLKEILGLAFLSVYLLYYGNFMTAMAPELYARIFPDSIGWSYSVSDVEF